MFLQRQMNILTYRNSICLENHNYYIVCASMASIQHLIYVQILGIEIVCVGTDEDNFAQENWMEIPLLTID